jgi:hypothetical protein
MCEPLQPRAARESAIVALIRARHLCGSERIDLETSRRFGTTAHLGTSTEIIVPDVGAHMQKFLELAKRMGAIQTKYQNAGRVNMWESSWAGSEAGCVIVTVEYPRLSLAESDDRARGAPELVPFFGDLDASGIKVLSEFLVTEANVLPSLVALAPSTWATNSGSGSATYLTQRSPPHREAIKMRTYCQGAARFPHD